MIPINTEVKTALTLLSLGIGQLLSAFMVYREFWLAPHHFKCVSGLALTALGFLVALQGSGKLASSLSVLAIFVALLYTLIYIDHWRRRLAAKPTGPGYQGWYTKRIADLEERVRKLAQRIRATVRRKSAVRLERDLYACRSMLWHLKAYARQHKINILPHKERLKRIHDGLRRADEELRMKQEEWWQTLLKLVAKTLDIVNKILSIFGIITNLQLPESRLRALPPGPTS